MAWPALSFIRFVTLRFNEFSMSHSNAFSERSVRPFNNQKASSFRKTRKTYLPRNNAHDESVTRWEF